ncbi:MAG: DUF2933 domain-containing protein [Burkholderiales bacterium]|jgi:hypothetical protein|uniref:DUF2933 domain-containing protein n=1 Tax=unclassified Aquabacterium TaxID=2620789 RepID=UPI0009E02F44|nr:MULTISPECIES: DUF2933 domain-containing protein [unclassified Aquabacterium]MBI3383456.1 DUF2933 domain-containing protein [Aquabacterium sp.]MDE2077601.1 DUF2933 domain-containing protein [Burkholderiales bacterium]
MDHQHDQQHDCEPASFWRSRYGVGLIVLGSVAGYFLWTEHRAHLAGALPFVLLLACPLMHVFMHHGHGHGQHGPHQHGSTGEQNDSPAPKTGDRP